MPFVGIESNGDIRDAGASAGLFRPWALVGASTLSGYPLRIVGMNALQAVITQIAGPLVSYEVQVIHSDFVGGSETSWVTVASGTLVAFGPTLVTVPVVVGHHARIKIASPGPGNSNGSFQLGAIHT